MVSKRENGDFKIDAWQQISKSITDLGLVAFLCLHCFKLKDESVIREHLAIVHGIPLKEQNIVYSQYPHGKPKSKPKTGVRKTKKLRWWEKADQNRAMRTEMKHIHNDVDTRKRKQEARGLERKVVNDFFGLTEEIEFEKECRETVRSFHYKERMDKMLRERQKRGDVGTH